MARVGGGKLHADKITTYIDEMEIIMWKKILTKKISTTQG